MSRGQQHVQCSGSRKFDLKKILNTLASSSQPFLRVAVSDVNVGGQGGPGLAVRGIIIVSQHCAGCDIQTVSQHNNPDNPAECPVSATSPEIR